ncbi:hypothetical protein [Sandaracinus amylolyticus]|uniref:hypothetical protein n=1 Tax=Sandaracinus amylolyticus TaxID=927083 RepID=UPI001F2A221F|nr:hypothetical protein [Sandaracinus amylolyticus]UJR84862.1 Hypothetical protein I5071_69410 [Sandaracinus amylolyticus]
MGKLRSCLAIVVIGTWGAACTADDDDGGGRRVDAGRLDAGASVDAQVPAIDAAPVDAAPPLDSGRDASAIDAGLPDSGAPDAGSDAGSPCTGVDCSAMDGPCVVGVCDPGDGTCGTMPRPDDTDCDDGDACTEDDVCTAGTCGGTAVDCSSMDDACNVGTCDATGACAPTPRPDDTGCDDGDRCTTDDVCTAGVCEGVATTCDDPILAFPPGVESPMRGNTTGGTRYDDACPEGQVLIGFDGLLSSANGYFQRLAAVCGTPALTPDGSGGYTVSIGAGATLPLRGGHVGPVMTSTRCAPGEIVTAFAGRRGALVDSITISCASLTVTGSGASLAIAIGTPAARPSIGGSGGTAFAESACPAGSIARGAVIRAGDSLDAIALMCSVPELQ